MRAAGPGVALAVGLAVAVAQLQRAVAVPVSWVPSWASRNCSAEPEPGCKADPTSCLWCAAYNDVEGKCCSLDSKETCCGGGMGSSCCKAEDQCCRHYLAQTCCDKEASCCGGGGPGASSSAFCCDKGSKCCGAGGTNGYGTCCNSTKPVCCSLTSGQNWCCDEGSTCPSGSLKPAYPYVCCPGGPASVCPPYAAGAL